MHVYGKTILREEPAPGSEAGVPDLYGTPVSRVAEPWAQPAEWLCASSGISREAQGLGLDSE